MPPKITKHVWKCPQAHSAQLVRFLSRLQPVLCYVSHYGFSMLQFGLPASTERIASIKGAKWASARQMYFGEVADEVGHANIWRVNL